MGKETMIWLDKKGVGHAFDDEYSVTIHHDTAEEMKQTARFLKYRAFWRPAAEAPEKDDFYLVTVAGWYIGCREPFVAIAEYEDGEWSEGEAVLAWAPLPEPYEGKGESMLKAGDYIKCHDKDEMLNRSLELGKAGIQTEFVYEMNGEEGLWLVITEVEDGAD